MNDQIITPSGGQILNVTQEYPAKIRSGYPMLIAILIGILAVIGSAILISTIKAIGLIALITSILFTLFFAAGFYFLGPNQGAAIQLFGTDKGTDRISGLRWRLPWLTSTKISVRVHNVTSETVKVNDLRGNPVEIATNVVWRVTDTGKALFDVEHYDEFVDIQIESAIRVIGARYPYDSITDDEVTLRGDADEISEELEKQLQERVLAAGVTIDECRLTHLAYAPEIAGAMLRRQQAQAVVSARQTLVEGAVGMVETALEMLSEKDVVELDDERKAAMVSNLMVVLCGERDTQPIVNTGSLYN